MSAPRKPLAVHLLSGSAAHDPQRFRNRTNEPVPSAALGDPPAYFTDEMRELWNELVAVAPPGALGNSDCYVVEAAVMQITRMRDPKYPFKAADFGVLNTTLGKIGLSPSDRTRLSVPKQEEKKEDDPWSTF